MKTLKEICADINLYEAADIPERYTQNDFFDHRIKCGAQPIPEFLQGLEGYECGLYYEAKQDTDYQKNVFYYIDHSYILLKKNGSDILMLLRNDRDKKQYFHLHYTHLNKYHNISHDIRQKAINSIKEPNRIGVFSAKKVDDWANYCQLYYEAMERVYSEVNNKNAEIEAEIAAFIQSVPGCKVSKWANQTNVETPLFYVTFEHFKDQNYLSTKIQYKGGLANVTKIHNQIK